MKSMPAPEYAILGHPNEGKSAVVSTLAEDDSVKVSPTPGETVNCRTFPVLIDGREVIRFTDTPGFQRPAETLKWMEAYSGEAGGMIGAFLDAHRYNDAFRNECELFAPVETGAGIIFVVDGSRPIRRNDRIEMEILRLTGCPRMAIINCKADEDGFLDDWRDAFRRNFNAIRLFDAHSADYRDRIALLESLKAIDQDWHPALEEVISAIEEDHRNRHRRVADIVCDLLQQALRYTVSAVFQTESRGKAAVPAMQQAYLEGIAKLEEKAHGRIRKLYRHRRYQVDLPAESVLDEPLFAKRTWQVLGLAKKQLAGIAAMSGGLVGAGLDIAAHGLTFGVFTAIGSAVAAGSAYLYSEQMARSRIVGLKLGGYRVSVGPNENLNFPYILLDRALLYTDAMANWAHGRRDYPERTQWLQPANEGKAGFASSWSAGDKRVCQAYFRAIHKGDEIKREQAGDALSALLMKRPPLGL